MAHLCQLCAQPWDDVECSPPLQHSITKRQQRIVENVRLAASNTSVSPDSLAKQEHAVVLPPLSPSARSPVEKGSKLPALSRSSTVSPAPIRAAPRHATLDEDPEEVLQQDYRLPSKEVLQQDYRLPSKEATQQDYRLPSKEATQQDYRLPSKEATQQDYRLPSKEATQQDYRLPSKEATQQDYRLPSKEATQQDYRLPSTGGALRRPTAKSSVAKLPALRGAEMEKGGGGVHSHAAGSLVELRGLPSRRVKGDQLRSFGYMTISPIAQGAFSQVVRARRVGEQLKEEFAVKTWARNKLQKDRGLAAAMRTELEALEKISERHHPHVANMVDVLENRQATHAVLEYCGGGSLLKYLQTKGHGRGLDEQEASRLVRQMSEALVTMHEMGVTHRDVKPANVLFTDSTHRSLKICDFGFALVCHQRRIKSVCGSPAYMAPEIWKREPYLGPPVDVWALGALAYELLHNRPCFSDESMQGLEVRIKRGAHNALLKETSSGFRHLIKGLFTLRPEERLTAAQVARHDWVMKSSSVSAH